MRRHIRYQRLLAFPDELTLSQRDRLAYHLQNCAACRETAATIQANQAALGGVRRTSPPSALRERVQTATAVPSPPRRRIFSRRRHLGIAAVACLASALWATVTLVGKQSATPANAYALLQHAAEDVATPYPYTGSAQISFTRTPWYLLPPSVTDYAGHYLIRSRWWVKDANHFRVDVQIFNPVLERGSIVAVLNGNVLTTYDSREKRATILTRRDLFYRLGMTTADLLAFLENAAQIGDIYNPTPVGPNVSIQKYLSTLRAGRRQSGVHSYARVVGQTRMLGQRVDIIEFAPLAVLSYDSGGCYPVVSAAPHATPVIHPPSGGCHHYVQPLGWARVYVGVDTPVILRFEEHGVNHIENALAASINYRYQVTSLRLRAQPPSGKFLYRPPVPAVPIRPQRMLSVQASTDQSREGQPAPPFLYMPEPEPKGISTLYEGLATTYYSLELKDGLFRLATPALPSVPGIDVLFARNPRWTKIYTSWHGQAGIYITGRYVLVQERKLATGLPASFTAHSARQAGRCRAWTGTYSDGQRWIAFRLHGISIVVSSNALTRTELIEYVSRDVCVR